MGEVEWIHLAQGRDECQVCVNVVNEPLGSVNMLRICW
jgi:hypothetical protein